MLWQLTPVFLPGKSHGQRSLASYSPWGCNESDSTWQLNHHCLPDSKPGIFSWLDTAHATRRTRANVRGPLLHSGRRAGPLCPASYLPQFPKLGSSESSPWGSRLALTFLLICVLAHTQLLFQTSGLDWWCSCLGDLPEPGAALAVLG